MKSVIANLISLLIEKTLNFVGKNFSKEVLSNIQLSINAKECNKRNFQLITPAKVAPCSEDNELIVRIMTAYRKAKEAQLTSDPIYLPSSLWQKQLDEAYCSLQKNNNEEIGFFFRNFGSWPIYTGIENSVLIDNLSKSFISRKKLWRMFDNLLTFWELHEQKTRTLESISYPRYGNQSGIEINGTFIGIGSVFNDVHSSVIANLLSDINRPIIAEIGGGYGKLFYFISRKIENFCYIDFDLPETLSLASYYLIKTFPNKKFLLFGEGCLSKDAINNYDFILMPSFCIDDLPSYSVNIFLNKNSFGEMLPKTTKKFINHIERTTNNWFWHMNHEIIRNNFNDGSKSLVNSEYQPSEKVFKLISRYFDVGHAVFQGGFDYNSDIYCYIYKAISSKCL